MGLCWSEPPPPPVQTRSPVYQEKPQPVLAPPVQYTYPVQQYMPTNYAIQLNVRTLTGSNLPVVVYISETIYQLKQRIQAATGILPDRQRLLYMGKELEDNRYIFYYQMMNGVTIHLVVRL